MTNVIQFPIRTESELDQLVEEVLSSMQHPDPSILMEWQRLAKPILQKYLRLPSLSQSKLSFTLPQTISEEASDAIEKLFQGFVDSYRTDMDKHTLAMLAEMIKMQLQLVIATRTR